MDHMKPAVIPRIDSRSSRICEFCREFDPKFLERNAPDQVVAINRRHTASAHLTEDGYVRHRMLELRRIASRTPTTAV
jgi:hypothetical protein